jgi:hypothetical protein
MEPHEKVKQDNYFRDVLGNIYAQAGLDRASAKVRFGNTGDGVSPHYQVEVNGLTRRYSGKTHKAYHEDAEVPFEDVNLSPGTFSATDVQAMIASRAKPKPAQT